MKLALQISSQAMMFDLWRIKRNILARANNLAWLAIAIICLAAFLRIFNLGKESLWLDEAFQVQASNNSWSTIIQICIHFDTHPPLYYLLQHLWMLLFGQSEAAVRSLSACLGIISILLAYMVGRELFGRRTGLIGAFFLAISYDAIAVSQEGRPYSLLMMLTLLSFFLFIKILKADKPTKAQAFLYVLANLLLCYTHIYGLFALGSQLLYFLLFRRSYAKAQFVLMVSYIATLIGFGPWIYALGTSILGQGIHGLDWIPRPSLGLVLSALLGMAGGAGFISLLFILLSVAGVFHLTTTKIRRFLGKGVQTIGHIEARISITEQKIALLLMWFVVPLALSLVISFAIRPIFFDRYLVGIIPALCLLVARGVDNVSLIISTYIKRASVMTAGMAVTLIIVLLVVPNLYVYYVFPHKEQWREAVQLIESNTKPGDTIVIYPDGYKTPFDYYYKGDPSMIVSSDVVQNGYSVASTQRIWLVLMDYASTYNAPIKGDLFTRYGNDSLVLQKHFNLINVYLFDTQLESSEPHS